LVVEQACDVARSRDSLPHLWENALADRLLSFACIASHTEPTLCLEMRRHAFEARRELQKVSSDVWQMGLIRQLPEFLGSLAV
jgi:hypothetical protein